MRLRFGGDEWVGRAVDVRGSGVSATRVAAAVRAREAGVVCRRPGPLHEHVGLLAEDTEVTEAVRAAVARSWAGGEQEGELAEAARPEDPVAVRQDVAAALGAVEGAREAVAVARGRLRARRETGAETGAAKRALRDAARELSEAETERAAAEERLAAARERARAQRDERARALRERDRRRNEAKRLAARAAPRIERARAAVPDCSWTPALAVVRAGRVRAPVVLAGGPFERPARAAACLDAPVVLADPLEV